MQGRSAASARRLSWARMTAGLAIWRRSDPRFLATLDRIGEELVTDSLVRRNQPDGSDRLPGGEGTFNISSFCYVEALTRAGRVQEGRSIFEKMLTQAKRVGLFAEDRPAAPSGDQNPPTGRTDSPAECASALSCGVTGSVP